MNKLLITVIISIFLMKSYIFATDIIVNDNMELIVDGVNVQNKNAPIVTSGIILVPLRGVITKLGVCDDDEYIMWNNEERKVTIIKEEKNIELKIDSDVIAINGEEFKLKAPAIIYDSRTYIPLDFIEQTFDKKMVLIPDEPKIVIRDKEEYLIIKETLNNVNKAISQIKKIKVLVNMKSNINQTPKTSVFVDTYMEATMDLKDKAGYIMSRTSIYDLLINNEVYFKYKVTYTRYQEAKRNGVEQKKVWEACGEGNVFNDMPERFICMSQLGTGEYIYGMFIIDEGESNSSTLVVKNDLSSKSLIKQLINNQLILGTAGQISEEDLLGIEDIYLEYKINKKTYNPESMHIKFKIVSGDSDFGQDKVVTDTIDIDIEFKDINGKFEVVRPK